MSRYCRVDTSVNETLSLSYTHTHTLSLSFSLPLWTPGSESVQTWRRHWSSLRPLTSSLPFWVPGGKEGTWGGRLAGRGITCDQLWPFVTKWPQRTQITFLTNRETKETSLNCSCDLQAVVFFSEENIALPGKPVSPTVSKQFILV